MPVDHFCLSCSKEFATISALRSHSKAKNHKANPFVCEPCELSFLSSMALESHMNSQRHADDYDSDAGSSDCESLDDDPYCDGCERQFINMVALNQHLFSSSRHNWCFDCSRDFSSPTALLQHQNSLAHRGRDLKCPFCQGMFKSPAGIFSHIESGCHNVTRQRVTIGLVKPAQIDNHFNDLTGQFSRLLKC